MLIHLRRGLGVLTSSLTLCLIVLLAPPSWAAEKARLRVDDYQIDATLSPHLHQISARAKVKFMALQDVSVAVFELHTICVSPRFSTIRASPSPPSASRRIPRCVFH